MCWISRNDNESIIFSRANHYHLICVSNEDDVTIDDFREIKGPRYIGKSSSFICMGSLVRTCIIKEGTTIGFNCEIAKSYFAGNNDKPAHRNVILDSIVGKNVWFGGYSGTAIALAE